jgi:hypothetical protein
VLIIIALLTLGLFIIACMQPIDDKSLLFEGAKALPQVGLVLVAGAIVSFLTSEYQQSRQQSERDASERRRVFEARVNLLRAAHTAVTSAYSDLKGGRRLVRAKGLYHDDSGSRMLVVTSYDDYLTELSANELRIESLAQEMAATPEAYSKAEQCIYHLRNIERIIHAVIAEYETVRPMIATADAVSLERVPQFRKLLARQGVEPELYREGFYPLTEAVWAIRRLLRADLLSISGVITGEPRRDLADEQLEGRWRITG